MFTGVALMGILAACNTTSDPTESIPNPDEGAPPKKILEKVSMNSISQEEYITSGGILEQAVFKAGNSNAYYTGTLTYNTNKKITKVNFVSQTSGSTAYEFNITPDANGMVYNASCTATASTSGNSYVSDFIFSYNVDGKLTKILEKRKVGGISAYNKFIENVFTYNGNNIFKVTCSNGILDSDGDPDMTTATKTIYSFQNYDSQKSPFATLPKVFFLVRGLVDPVNFYRMSPNNPTSIYVQMPAPAPGVNISQSYTYDNQGYPLTEKNQKIAYSYKNL